MLTCYCGKINSLLVDGLDGNSWFIFRGRFLTFLWHKYVHSMYYLMGKYRYNNGELSTHYRAIVEHAWVFQRHSLYNELTIPDQSKWWWLLMIQVHPAKQFEQWNFWVLGSHVPRVHQWTWGNMPSQHLQVQSTWCFHWAHQHLKSMRRKFPRRRIGSSLWTSKCSSIRGWWKWLVWVLVLHFRQPNYSMLLIIDFRNRERVPISSVTTHWINLM